MIVVVIKLLILASALGSDTKSLLLLHGAVFYLRGLAGGAIPSQICHPPYVLIDVIRANHMHDLACILLRMLVFKLSSKSLICLLQK